MPAKRRKRLTRETVLDAALVLADAGGLAALSMRSLGEALGVEAMALYRHVANKDDLLDALVERVVSEIEVPTVGGDWKQAMRRRAHSTHAALRRHPWATLLLLSRVNVGPSMLRHVDATIGCLVAAGFDYPTADHAWNAIDNHVYGFALQEANFPFHPDEYARQAEAYLPMIPVDRYPHLHGMAREIIDGRHDGIGDLSFGLELILDGLERVLHSATPPR